MSTTRQQAVSRDPLAAHLELHAERALDGLAALDALETPEARPTPEQAAAVELVHETRTSLRRMRSALRTFTESFPAPGSAAADLRYMAIALGAVRDADVLSELLGQELAALPAELVPTSTRDDLEGALAARRARALQDVARARQDPRWERAVDQLTSWRQTPPTLVVRDPARLLSVGRREVRDRIRRSAGDPVALHSARRAAKRWRYAAELLVEVDPVAADHLDQATQAQRLLGQVQDAVIACAFLREHARLGDRAGHNAFVTGVLFARVEHRRASASGQAMTLL